MTSIIGAARLATGGDLGESVAITRERVKQIPYASMSGKIANGPLSILVLGKKNADQLYWYSADNAVIVTKRGRVVQTAGLPLNLSKTVTYGTDPINSLQMGVAPNKAFRRSVDLAPGDRFVTTLRCNWSMERDEAVVIAEVSYATRRFRERCSAETFTWEFENVYWADMQSGFVWKSVQHYAPNTPALELAVLRPAD